MAGRARAAACNTLTRFAGRADFASLKRDFRDAIERSKDDALWTISDMSTLRKAIPRTLLMDSKSIEGRGTNHWQT
jgi:hypothetical protein